MVVLMVFLGDFDASVVFLGGFMAILGDFVVFQVEFDIPI